MAFDADETVIAANGHVYVAAVGATPAVGIAAPTTGWTEMGFLSTDGVNFEPSVEMGELRAWQSKYPIRRFENSRSLDISFTLLQWNKTTLPFALGGGSILEIGVTDVYEYTPPVAGSLDERAMNVMWNDGTRDFSLLIPRGVVSDLGSFSLNSDDAAGMAVTFSVLSETGVAPFTIRTDDAAHNPV
jgi:hypothetical protein